MRARNSPEEPALSLSKGAAEYHPGRQSRMYPGRHRRIPAVLRCSQLFKSS